MNERLRFTKRFLPLTVALALFAAPLAVVVHAEEDGAEQVEEHGAADHEEPSDASSPPAQPAPRPRRPAAYGVPKRSPAPARAVPVRVEEGVQEDADADDTGDQSRALGGAGISSGGPAEGIAPNRPKSASPAPGSSSGSCLIENVDWYPGCGGLNSQGMSQAMRAQPEGKTIAYRITASQLASSGSLLIPDNAPANFEMWLSNTPCGSSAAAGACRKTTEIAYHDPKALTPEQLNRINKDPSFKSSYCLLPSPAGKNLGQNFWYLNIRPLTARCDGGSCKRMLCWTPALKAGTTAVSYDGKMKYEAGSNPWR